MNEQILDNIIAEQTRIILGAAVRANVDFDAVAPDATLADVLEVNTSVLNQLLK